MPADEADRQTDRQNSQIAVRRGVSLTVSERASVKRSQQAKNKVWEKKVSKKLVQYGVSLTG